jgi:hypothetical protein
MASSKFTAGAIVPALEVWGGYQRFEFDDHFVKLQTYNKFVPFGLNSSVVNTESINNNLAGFRFRHVTSATSPNNYGTFSLNHFNNAADTIGTEIFLYDTGNFYLKKPVFMQEDLSMGSKKIIDLATPVLGTDAANKDYVDSMSGGGTVTLGGSVTGSGSVGSTITTTLTTTLNNVPLATGNVNLNNNKIINLTTPTIGSDGANKTYVDSAISSIPAGTITLTGNVTGSGSVGTPFATTIASRLNQIPTPTGAVNMNSQNLISVGNIGVGVASPTLGLQFPNAVDDCKICLWQNAANSFQVYGFGVTAATLKYSVGNSVASHVFYCGATSTTSTELFRITGTGNVGIGVAAPNTLLQFPDVIDTCKISLYQTATNKFQVYGFGVTANTLRYSVPTITNSHVFYAATSSSAANEIFRIHGSGYISADEGNGTIYGRRPSAHVSMYANSTNTTSTGVWVKLNGTTTATAGAVQCTTSNNRITFTGSDLGVACVGMVSGSATLSFSVGASCLIGIYKNGTTLLSSPVTSLGNVTGGTGYTITIPNIMVSLSPTDYVEVWALTSASGTITTQHLNLSWFAC